MTLVAILKDLYFKRCADTEVHLDLSVGVTIFPAAKHFCYMVVESFLIRTFLFI